LRLGGFYGLLVEAGLASDHGPRPELELLSESEQEVDELRVRRKVRSQAREQTGILEEWALITWARFEDVDCGEEMTCDWSHAPSVAPATDQSVRVGAVRAADFYGT
jgi:hypothetical protein